MSLKSPLTYAQQVDKLLNAHNLSIPDPANAEKILSKVNYYRLSGYGIGLYQKGSHELYRDNLSIENLYNIYIFDSRLRNILMSVIEQVEIEFRTKVANYHSLKYGADGYMQKSNFNVKIDKDGNEIYDLVINRFNSECIRQKNKPFVIHHINKYNGEFPLWVAVELFTFGNLSSLYDIMPHDDKDNIARFYNTKANYLNSWLLAILEVRNICAHFSRLYNLPLQQTPHLYKENKKYRGKFNKLFPVLLVIKRMLNSDDRWDSFYKNLVNLMQEFQNEIIPAFMDFPIDWKTVLKGV